MVMDTVNRTFLLAIKQLHFPNDGAKGNAAPESNIDSAQQTWKAAVFAQLEPLPERLPDPAGS
jgi:hypothetical protein